MELLFTKIVRLCEWQAWRKLENSEGATSAERSEAGPDRVSWGRSPRNFFGFSCKNCENLAIQSKNELNLRRRRNFFAKHNLF